MPSSQITHDTVSPLPPANCLTTFPSVGPLPEPLPCAPKVRDTPCSFRVKSVAGIASSRSSSTVSSQPPHRARGEVRSQDLCLAPRASREAGAGAARVGRFPVPLLFTPKSTSRVAAFCFFALPPLPGESISSYNTVTEIRAHGHHAKGDRWAHARAASPCGKSKESFVRTEREWNGMSGASEGSRVFFLYGEDMK